MEYHIREHLLDYFKKFDIVTLREMLQPTLLKQTFEDDYDAYQDLQELIFRQLFNSVSFYKLSDDLLDYCNEVEPEESEESEEEQ